MGKQGKLVLVPAPFQGHMSPMFQLGAALHSKGLSITVVHTKFNSPDYSNHPDFSFHALSENLTNIDPGLTVVEKGVAVVEKLNDICKIEFQEHLAHMMELQEPNDMLLGIIHDDIMYFPEAIASNLKIPSFVFRTNNASFLHAYLAVPRLHQEGYIPVQDSIMKELVPELYPLRFKDLPISDNHELTIKLLAITSGTRTTSAIIWNTIDFLEQSTIIKLQKHFQVPVFPVGPLHKFCLTESTSFLEEDRSCIEWLDKQAPKSVIYASLGSLSAIDEEELVETAWGLVNSGQPFLWVVRPDSVVQDSEKTEFFLAGFIEKVGSRGYIVSWAPQKEVLAHGAVGGFWSHCGWNSCLESISEGVPMICRPSFVDQKVNSRYLTYEWKVGIELEQDLERGTIASAIRTLLVEKEGVEIRQRAIEMKEKIRACVQEGGSSYKSLSELAEFLPSCFAKFQGLKIHPVAENIVLKP